MSLLGDDGRGYDLARRLEALGVWRTWLGDSAYSSFFHFLSSPTSWDSFMRADGSKSRAQIQIQLRVRALLFDKATVSLFMRSSANSSSLAVSKLNPNYLQLHGDDVYFTLEDALPEAGIAQSAKSQAKSVFTAASRFGETESDSLSKSRSEELPETWYNRFFEKYRLKRPYKLSSGDQESEKRNPEQMSMYLRILEKHKRRRVAFLEDGCTGGVGGREVNSNMHLNSVLDSNNPADDDMTFFPETMFLMNCVPDSALSAMNRTPYERKVEVYGVLDTLPQVTTRSPVMIERLGIRPEYLSIEHRGSMHRRKNDKKQHLGQDQASQISRKVIARLLHGVGFESATEAPLEVFSQFLSCHIGKLGRNLKVLADNYRKQCSAVELIKMFLHTAGYSNFGNLAELVKDSTRNVVQQSQQQLHAMQSQNQIHLPQQVQIPRQLHPQMQQMVHTQNLTMQQQHQLQLFRWRQQQAAATRPVMVMDMEKEQRPLVQVKIENASELPVDSNNFNSMNVRNPQMQFRQQQISPMSNLQPQPGNQYRQMASPQIPQIHSPNMSMVRAPPVKVEGFQELMGGDSTIKHDSEENKLTSPSK